VSIQPPSDIVLDVAQAADPAKSLAATEKLARLGAPDGSGSGFTDAVDSLRASADAAGFRSQVNLNGGRAMPKGPVDPSAKVYKGLEALILQNMVETMLPKDASDFFGKGSGGEIWRSMLAQQLGTQISNNVDLGLASKAEQLHPPLAHARPPFPAHPEPANAVEPVSSDRSS
jgi:flagellar protein FlgJ